MKNLFLQTAFICLSYFANGQQTVQSTSLAGSYFGQKTPGITPEVFAKGIISIPEGKYCTISFTGEMDEFYLYRWNGTKAEILFSRVDNGIWRPLKEVDFTSGFKAMEPHILFDGQKLFFNWEKPAPAGEPNLPFNIWYTERTSTGWSAPKYAGVGMFVSSDRSGNIYTTDMNSLMSNGKTFLSKVKFENGRFTKYEKQNIVGINGSPAHPCIAPDGSFLIFDIDSGHHLFVSFKSSDGTWGKAIDLADHGFDLMAGGASITSDGKYLFFNLKGQLMWVDIKVITDIKQ